MKCVLSCGVLTVAFLAGSMQAQCSGSGARLEQTPPTLGRDSVTTVLGGPGEAFSVFLSGGVQFQSVPGLGTVCLDFTSPLFAEAFSGTLNAEGRFALTTSIPNTPAWASALFYLQGIVQDAASTVGWSLTNTLRKDYLAPDSWVSAGGPADLDTRAMTATLVPERGWVFVTVSHAQSSETRIYYPLARASAPGPHLLTARRDHRVTALGDGRILITGGIDASMLATATCEIYDPATQSISPAAPMSVPRALHVATALADGRVLVAGGTSGTEQAGPAAPTGEVFDPATGNWTPVSNGLLLGRTAAAAHLLDDGRVLITGGFDHPIPVFIPSENPTCELYDPASNAFVPAPPMTVSRAYHQISRLGDGSLFVTGGVTGFIGQALESTERFAGSWSPGPDLPVSNIFATDYRQVALADGRVLLCGERL